MAVEIIPRPNIGSSGIIEIIDGIEFEGFGSGGFGEDDFLYIGDALDNFIQGDFGNDELEGNNGNDTLKGGAGNDIVDGDSGNDDLDGQGGTDKLFGGPGDDILRAGDGHDQLYGGPGNDTFGFYNLGHFRIHDFTPGEDRLFFDTASVGIDSLEKLVPFVTAVDQSDGDLMIEFGPNLSIDIVGVQLGDLSPDMIVFQL
ncbi:MAG TPA: hemolysin expression modulating protein [Nitrosomonas sp.]|uniref:calcium-binding protein n=1 Tax=Nitrosomonas sp. TaxID=42353 RepID=UPI0020872E7E|nr:hemolysin expression modulating protein [Nitrosomonas sp.]GJL76700.1 MAG: hemolysin expression modulating protein [Nitrosomonas sp.]HNP26507.1 hemolysin expression modulating protein [Nitrosomonas sp.]